MAVFPANISYTTCVISQVKIFLAIGDDSMFFLVCTFQRLYHISSVMICEVSSVKYKESYFKILCHNSHNTDQNGVQLSLNLKFTWTVFIQKSSS